jgi:hypothetical protein
MLPYCLGAIPVLEFFQESWTNMATHQKFIELSDAIEAGLWNLNKWYRNYEEQMTLTCDSFVSVNIPTPAFLQLYILTLNFSS